MSANFDPSLKDPVSRVRQLVGDTDQQHPLSQDETILYYLTTRSELATAAQIASDIAAFFASRQVDTVVDGQQFSNSQRARHFTDLANRLTRQAAEQSAPTDDTGAGFCGLSVHGGTTQEVLDARCDPNQPSNIPPGMGIVYDTAYSYRGRR
jgi:hypothetical protein